MAKNRPKFIQSSRKAENPGMKSCNIGIIIQIDGLQRHSNYHTLYLFHLLAFFEVKLFWLEKPSIFIPEFCLPTAQLHCKTLHNVTMNHGDTSAQGQC